MVVEFRVTGGVMTHLAITQIATSQRVRPWI